MLNWEVPNAGERPLCRGVCIVKYLYVQDACKLMDAFENAVNQNQKGIRLFGNTNSVIEVKRTHFEPLIPKVRPATQPHPVLKGPLFGLECLQERYCRLSFIDTPIDVVNQYHGSGPSWEYRRDQPRLNAREDRYSW